MNKRKSIVNTIFLLTVFLITIYYIFHGKDMSSLLKYIQNTDMRYWFLAVICVILFIGSEAGIIFYMMHTIQQKINIGHCLLYSFVGFFFSCITPSATGGQPAQIYYMKKDKIPIPVATLILMIVTITYKMVLVAIGIIVVIIRPAEIMRCLNPVLGICYLGLALNIICVGFMVLLVFHPKMAHNMFVAIIKILIKIHLFKLPKYFFKKIEHAMQQYKDVAMYFGTHKMVVWNVLLITIIQRLLLFYVTYLAYRSFGLNETGVATIVVLQGMISVAVDMLPLPGGMGISEKLFLMIFTPLFGSVTWSAMIVSRGLSYYTEIIISSMLTIVAYFVIGRDNERKKIK
jgi:uncharacterized protein (TIRG00374 family)